MKKFKKIAKIVSLTFLLIFSLSAVAVSAEEPKSYTVLTSLPGIGDNGTGKTNLNNYLPAAFNLTIGIAAGMAFVVIVFGGITYAVSDSLTGKEDGKKWVTNAIYGLLLVIGAYVILYTINPQILEFKLTIPRPKIESGVPTVVVGTPMTQEALAQSNANKDALAGYGIQTKPPCKEGQLTNCVNLNGLPAEAMNGLIALKQTDCKTCTIFISGGTEGGHATHGAGAAIVDLRPDVGLNQLITGNANTPIEGTTKVVTLKNGTKIGFTYETLGGNAKGTSSGGHWHVIFK